MARAFKCAALVVAVVVLAAHVVDARDVTVANCATYNLKYDWDPDLCAWTGCKSGVCPSGDYKLMCPDNYRCPPPCNVPGRGTMTWNDCCCIVCFYNALCCKYSNQRVSCAACNSGYALSSNKMTCSDINECASNPCHAQRTCVNTAGSYYCSDCKPGWKNNGALQCTACPAGTWGNQCQNTCNCQNGGTCNPVNGACTCAAGWRGATCTETTCGDGLLRGSEQCESPFDSCCDQATCRWKAVNSPCPDDNNYCTNDYCTATTPSPKTTCSHLFDASKCYCGNGKIDPTGEQCDDGNAVTEKCAYGQTSCTVCNNQCKLVAGATSYCGDGIIQTAEGEQCDDGNKNSGDGCSSTCQKEAGFKCTTPGAACATCPRRQYGIDCVSTCTGCLNDANCSPVDGTCSCTGPWIGSTCASLPTPNAQTITAISPSTFTVDVAPDVTLTGGIPSSITHYFFVPTTVSGGNVCALGNALAYSTYTSAPSRVSAGLANAGTYHLCYSTNPADTVYVHQTNIVVTVIAPAATATSISSISPTSVYVGGTFSVQVNGAVPSSTTKIAFSKQANCAARVLETAVPAGLSRPPTVSLGMVPHETPTGSDYFLCYSTVSGTWVKQTNVPFNVKPTPSGTDSIKTINGATTLELIIGETTDIDVNIEAAPSAESMFGFDVVASCEDTIHDVIYDTDIVTVPAFGQFEAGTYRFCYTTNFNVEGSFVDQQLVSVVVLAPAPTTTTITSVTPQFTSLRVQTLTFAGIVPSATTRVALIKASSSDCSTGRVSEVAVTAKSEDVDMQVAATGKYKVCLYTGTGGSGWVLQDGLETEAFPPAATDATISTIVTECDPLIPQCSIPSSDSSYANVPAFFSYGGAVPSAYTYVAFVEEGKTCSDAVDICPPNWRGDSCEEPSEDENEIPEGAHALLGKRRYTDTRVIVQDVRMIPGTYSVCYSTDDGAEWHQQTAVSLRVFAPPADGYVISSAVFDSTIVRAETEATFTGAVPSFQTYVGLNKDASCPAASMQAVTLLETSDVATVTLPSETGLYYVCYTTDQAGGWVKQTPTVTLLPNPASATSVRGINPSIVFASFNATTSTWSAQPTFELTGADKSESTRYALTRTLDGCDNAATRFGESDYSLTSQKLAVPFGRFSAGTWYVCYTTDGVNWFLQQPAADEEPLTVRVRPEEVLSGYLVTHAYDRFYSNTTANVTVAGGAIWMDFVPLMPSEQTIVRMSTSATRCDGSTMVQIPYTSEATVHLEGFLVANDVFYICVSLDSGSNFTPQTLTISVRPPAPTPTTIKGLASPTASNNEEVPELRVMHRTTQRMRFVGIFPSPYTSIAFVRADSQKRSSDDCDPANFVVLTASPEIDVPAGTTELFFAADDTAGDYAICLSTSIDESARVYVKQTLVTLSIVAPPPTGADIPSLSPSQWAVGKGPYTVTVVGGLPSSKSVIGIVPSSVASCIPEHMVSTAQFTSRTVSFTNSLPAAGTYFVCYSTDGGESFVAQVPTVLGVAPLATPTTVTALNPPFVYASLPFNMTFVGAVASPNTDVAFVPKGTSCSLAQGSRYSADTVEFLALPTVGVYEICLSTTATGEDPSYIKQTNVELEARVPPATAWSVPRMSPLTAPAGASVTVTFFDFVPSPTSKAAFVAASGEDLSANCDNAAGRLNVVAVPDIEPIDLPSPFDLENTVYRLCYSTDNGETFVLQESIQTYLNVTEALTSASAAARSDLNLWLAVGAACLVVIIAVVLISVFYLKKQEAKRRAAEAADILGSDYSIMDPSMQTSLNPLYEADKVHKFAEDATAGTIVYQ